eukprot:842911-Amphidinium_carterae.1
MPKCFKCISSWFCLGPCAGECRAIVAVSGAADDETIGRRGQQASVGDWRVKVDNRGVFCCHEIDLVGACCGFACWLAFFLVLHARGPL